MHFPRGLGIAALSPAYILRERVELPAHTRYRLVGVGLGGFRDREELPPQPELFTY